MLRFSFLKDSLDVSFLLLYSVYKQLFHFLCLDLDFLFLSLHTRSDPRPYPFDSLPSGPTPISTPTEGPGPSSGGERGA